MKYTVYQTTCKINGKIYIGKHQTEDPYDDYLGSGKLLSAAIEKHGRENFEKKVLHIFDNEEDMNAKEAELVTEEFVKEDANYNLCPGGRGGWGYVNQNTPTNVLRQRGALGGKAAGKIIGKDNLAKLRAANLAKLRAAGKTNSFLGSRFSGRNHKTETKIKMSNSHKTRLKDPRNNSQFGTMWITNSIENKKIKKCEPIPEGWSKGRKQQKDLL